MTDHHRRAAILGVAEIYAADRAAVAAGVPSLALMEAAGTAVANAVERRARALGLRRRVVAILCGPGNNGGDGFVAARVLAARGWRVRLALLGDRGRLAGDAAVNAGRWHGPVLPLEPAVLDGAVLAVDALFGAGLSRPVEGAAAAVIEAIGRRRLPCLAVDVPSGVDGDSGSLRGPAPACDATVTFFRPKPAHLLYPARGLMGHLEVADIGIPDSVLEAAPPRAFVNGPALWSLPRPAPDDHKYGRGHAVVVGGAVMTGAGRLAARAARRMGAGLLTIAAPAGAVPLYAADAPGALTAALGADGALGPLLADPRKTAWLLGPGGGRGAVLRGQVLDVLATQRPVVLDADALTSFEADPATLFAAIAGPAVLTPHAGEFARLFPEETGSRPERARAAAARSGAVVVLKGPDTVIAHPAGYLAINGNAPPDLATAGAGDVLAGFVLALLAQGLPPFEAAAAAVWLHGEAARDVGPGLIAEDLPDILPAVLRRLSSL
jgi:NAD(P)H-hydrate epimerase